MILHVFIFFLKLYNILYIISKPMSKLPVKSYRKKYINLKISSQRCSGQNVSSPKVSILAIRGEKFNQELFLVFRAKRQSWGPIELGCPPVRLPKASVCHRFQFLEQSRTFKRMVIETCRLKWKILLCRYAFLEFRPDSANMRWGIWPELPKTVVFEFCACTCYNIWTEGHREKVLRSN